MTMWAVRIFRNNLISSNYEFCRKTVYVFPVNEHICNDFSENMVSQADSLILFQI